MTSNEELAVQLRLVRDSAQRLNAISDRAAATVQAVERFLNEKCSVGVEAWVDVSSSTDEDRGQVVYHESTKLGYARVGHRFRIAVLIDCSGMPDPETTPWSDCKRELKLETIEKLPELLAAIAKATDEKIAKAETAVDVASAVLAALGK